MSKLESGKQLLKFKRKLISIDINKIEPNRYNPREERSFTKLDDIIESIKKMGGILVPILVYEKSPGRYVILDGERRWKASKILAQKDKKFQKIPANIIEKPKNVDDNYVVMFNVHMERKSWSTGATAIAIGEIKKRYPNMSDKEISDILRVPETRILEASYFLIAPKDLQDRAIVGDLEAYHLIFLIRNLKIIESTYLDIVNEQNFDSIIRIFISKIDSKIIKNYREFNNLGGMLKLCKNIDDDSLFIKYFNKILDNEFYTPKEAYNDINDYIYNLKHESEIESEFINQCDIFLYNLDFLKKSILNKNVKMSNNLKNQLIIISSSIKNILENTKVQ